MTIDQLAALDAEYKRTVLRNALTDAKRGPSTEAMERNVARLTARLEALGGAA